MRGEAQLRPGCRCALRVALACVVGYVLCAALLVGGDTRNRELMAADAEYATAFLVRLVFGGLLLVALTTTTAYLAAARTIGPAASALQRQESLLADTAHDLRTPVAALRALAETAVANPHRHAELLPRTVELSRRMGAIIDGVLVRARLSAGVEPLVTEPVWLDQLVSVVVEETPADGAEVVVTTEPTRVAADPALLQRAVGNLLENALRHGRCEGRPAVVHVTVAGGRVTVADNGPGIDPALSAGMFDRFTGSGRSSGLGLSIVRWVVEAHDGTLLVRKGFGTGAAFEIALAELESISLESCGIGSYGCSAP